MKIDIIFLLLNKEKGMASSHFNKSADDKHKDSYSPPARLFGAGAGTLTAFCVNLPFETATTRIQISNKKFTKINPSEFYTLILNNQYNGIAHFPKHLQSLANGFTAGVLYKFVQGTFRYWCQPTIKDYYQNTKTINDFFKKTFGEKYSKPMREAAAGSTTGLLEVGLLPLDTLKKLWLFRNSRGLSDYDTMPKFIF